MTKQALAVQVCLASVKLADLQEGPVGPDHHCQGLSQEDSPWGSVCFLTLLQRVGCDREGQDRTLSALPCRAS